mgnify:CR=1 FL=1
MEKPSFQCNLKLKQARKTLKFWVKVLLTTELMNDKSDRIEVIDALSVIKQHSKLKSGT